MEAGQVNCFVCGRSQAEHAADEGTGRINHAFSSDGRMERSTVRAGKVAKPRPTVMITVVPAPDIALRRLLEMKGLITSTEVRELDGAPVIKPEDLGI